MKKLQKKESNELSIKLTPDEVQMVKQVYCPTATDMEFKFYLAHCKYTGLNPLLGHCYLVIRKQKDENGNYVRRPTIQISIDGFRATAELSGLYDGQDPPHYEYDEAGNLLSATVSVYRKDIKRPFVHTAFFSEYAQKTGEGKLTRFWESMKHNQLSKCAESGSFRKAFPRIFAKTYIEDELLIDNGTTPVTLDEKNLPEAEDSPVDKSLPANGKLKEACNKILVRHGFQPYENLTLEQAGNIIAHQISKEKIKEIVEEINV